MTRSYGRCRRGKRLRMGCPHGHRKTTTLVAGLRMTEAADARLLFLPPCSPDFNRSSRPSPASRPPAKRRPPHHPPPMKAIGRTIDLYTPQECANYFANCRYDAE